MNLQTPFALALGAALAATGMLIPSPAEACGGFFCDSAQPVNQQAERIIFAQQPDGTVTAVIQIQYQGPSEEFAWMLPVNGSPEVSVSSNAVFTRLQQATNPQYLLNTTVEGNCSDTGGGPGRGSPAFDSAGNADAGAGPAPVDVVAAGSVGPYDYVIIDVDPTADDQVAVAIDWLQGSGYDVPAMGSEVLRPYLEGGMNLLAFRLTKGNDAGSIRPVRLTFGPGLPSIPLRPTAIATQPDMGIMVWVLGQSRSIPVNYRSLELNEALINWLNPGSTYDDVVTRAANEAGGQGFVTEMAGAAQPIAEGLWSEREAQQWAAVQSADWSAREGSLLQEVANFLVNLDGSREVLDRHVPVPDGIDADEYFGCLFCYADFGVSDIEGFDPVAFVADMDATVVTPIVETQQLVASLPYVTRFYTTMSAHEMTADPMFDYNADLADVSNQHTADRIIECSPSVSRSEAPWRIELVNGQTVRGTGTTWPFATDSASMPANERIVRVGTEGEGEVETDNTGAIASALTSHNATVPGPRGSDGLCSVGTSTGRQSAGFLLALLMGLVAVRRRRS